MNNRVFQLLAILAVAVIGVLLWRANSGAPDPGSTRIINVTDETVVVSGELLNDPIPQEEYTLGVLYPFLAAPFWVNEAFGVSDQAEKLGVKVIWLSADGYDNIEKQNNQIQDLISQDVDAILLAATSYSGTAPAVDQAKQAGIPVFAHVTSSESEGVLISVVNDDVQIGRSQAKYMGESLNGAGNVALLNGPAAAEWASRRVNGFKEVIASEFPDITIVSEKFGIPDRADARNLAEDLITTFPELDGIFTVADGMGLGASDAVAAAGKNGEIAITTAAFSRETVPYIKDGRFSVNVDENPVLMGRTIVNISVRALNGEELPKSILIPSPEITAETVDEIDPLVQWAPTQWKLQ